MLHRERVRFRCRVHRQCLCNVRGAWRRVLSGLQLRRWGVLREQHVHCFRLGMSHARRHVREQQLRNLRRRGSSLLRRQ